MTDFPSLLCFYAGSKSFGYILGRKLSNLVVIRCWGHRWAYHRCWSFQNCLRHWLSLGSARYLHDLLVQQLLAIFSRTRSLSRTWHRVHLHSCPRYFTSIFLVSPTTGYGYRSLWNSHWRYDISSNHRKSSAQDWLSMDHPRHWLYHARMPNCLPHFSQATHPAAKVWATG